MTKRDEWIRVRSESELRAGMCVELRPNTVTRLKDRFILLRREIVLSECAGGHWCRGWNTVDRDVACVVDAIPEGRLFRLSDSKLIEDVATWPEPKRKVKE